MNTNSADVLDLPADWFVERMARLWIAEQRQDGDSALADMVEWHVDRQGGIYGLADVVAAGAVGVPVADIIVDAIAREAVAGITVDARAAVVAA
ncbi:hypothetical protein CH252_32945 [Rhodococcus sp. 06-1477-1B]|nr:hypothetical protein CH252_32945 [Rhodococcus sp. 06-1477-1B]